MANNQWRVISDLLGISISSQGWSIREIIMVGYQLVANLGREILRQVARLHFKTSRDILQ